MRNQICSLFFTITMLLISESESKCPIYKCSPYNLPADYDNVVCSTLTSTQSDSSDKSTPPYIYNLFLCPPTQTCLPSLCTTTRASFCTPPPQASLLPGETCHNNASCLNNHCNSTSKCGGGRDNSTCSSDLDCDMGFGCWEENEVNKCRKLLDVNEKCEFGSKCVSNARCNQNICKRLFSLPNQHDANDGYLCKTGYAVDGKCSDGPKMYLPQYACPDKSVCVYTIDGSHSDTVEAECMCGFNSNDTQGWCWPGTGSPVFKHAMANITKYLDQNDVVCHLDNELGIFCNNMQGSPGYDSARFGYLFMKNYAMYMGNVSECVKNIFPLNEYWLLEKKLGEKGTTTNNTANYFNYNYLFSSIILVAILL